MKITATKITANQSTSSRWLKMSYIKHVLLTKPTFTKHGKNNIVYNHKVRHTHWVYNKLDWSVYTCLTQL